MTDNSGKGRCRRVFWLGFIIGAFIGAAAFYLIGMALWDPPF